MARAALLTLLAAPMALISRTQAKSEQEPEMLIGDPPKSRSRAVFERWESHQELRLRAAEHGLRSRELALPWYRSPLIVAIVAGSVTLLGNIFAELIKADENVRLEDRKAEGSRVLAALDADNPDQAATNLELLIKAELITGSLKTGIQRYLDTRLEGEGAVTGRRDGGTSALEGQQFRFGDKAPKIALLVGHSAAQQGSFSKFLAKYEFEFNLPLALDLGRIIGTMEGQAPVAMRGSAGDKTVEIIGEFQPDISVEFHFNSAGSEDARGTQVFVRQDAGERTLEAAQSLSRTTAEVLGIPNRGGSQK